MTIVSHFFWNWYLFRNRSWVWRFAFAGIVPDLPYAVLLAYYSLRLHVNGFADLSAWDLVWQSPLSRALHSFVPWSAVALVGMCWARRPLRRTLVPILAGWLSHIVVDALTHHSDGYPIFYPLSMYRFPTPISYWEPAYHGGAFMALDTGCMLVLMAHYLTTRQQQAWRARRLARLTAAR